MPLFYWDNEISSLNNSKLDKYNINYHFPDNKLIFNDRFQKISYRKYLEIFQVIILIKEA